MSRPAVAWIVVCACYALVADVGRCRAEAPLLVAPTEALSPEEEQKRFHLPPGFEIQLVASEPDIQKPMNITFDATGRLFVTDTVEYPYPVTGDAVPRDTVKTLVDRNLDGRADRITTFVDRLNIPLGVMPIPRGVLVYGIPSVMRCLDTDEDGKADTRDVLYTGFGHRDTHGMVNSFTRGLDGWLYACHGFANDSAVRGSDGHQIKMNSGNTFRMRLDGSRVEYHTHGQVNPFGLAFDPLGNLYSADCHSLPVYMLLRGAYYPSFGKPHDGLGFAPAMLSHLHGSTGIGGIAYYAARQFPPEYRDTIFLGNPVTGRVNHDRLQPHGSTYQAIEQPDFITCDDPWFRPVNLQVGPDGALYIADFYNKIIGHYEVPLTHPGRDRHRGRVWRVVYTGDGVERPADSAPPFGPNVAQAPLGRLIELLGDGNLAIRTAATHELVDRIGPSTVGPLRALLASSAATPWQRVHGMWVLERLDGLDTPLVEALAGDDDRAVRVHVMKLLAERSWENSPLVSAALEDPDPFVRRAAADALARHPSINNVSPLLRLWASTPQDDTHLVHVARMALRDQLLAPGAYGRLTNVVGKDRAALGRVADVSLGVPTGEAARFLLDWLRANPATSDRETYLHHVARHMPADWLDEVHAFALGFRDADAEDQTAVVLALGRAAQQRGARLGDDVARWALRLSTDCLASDTENRVQDGIRLARELALPLFDRLAAAAGPQARFENLRRQAIDACVAQDAPRATSLVAAILANPAEPINLRQHAAAALAQINDDDARAQLLKNLETAPLALAVEIAAALADSAPGAEGLLAAVASGKASARLLQERIVVSRLQIRNLDDFDARLEKLTAGLPPADERIGALIERRRKLVRDGRPNVEQGAAAFQKHCANCHRIGQQGEKIGPNLDGVGIRGLERLLEDVLDPSRNVDQAFRTTHIVTADGRVTSGLALRDEGQVLVLADSQGKQIRVPLDEIDQRTLSQLSPMPANVPELLSEADFVDLVGYLLEQRAKEPANE